MFIRLPFFRQASTAPVSSDKLSSATIISGSNSEVVPSPWQSGQAPCGLLNEKTRGSSSGRFTSGWIGQANFSLNTWSVHVPSGLPTVTITSPCESFSAVSIESARRARISGFSTMRSTIASMLWAKVFFSSGGLLGSSSVSTPSTRARTNPCLWMAWKTSRCSPLPVRTSGERTISLVPVESRETRSTICEEVCPAISRPHFQQCGMPARAKSTRR